MVEELKKDIDFGKKWIICQDLSKKIRNEIATPEEVYTFIEWAHTLEENNFDVKKMCELYMLLVYHAECLLGTRLTKHCQEDA